MEATPVGVEDSAVSPLTPARTSRLAVAALSLACVPFLAWLLPRDRIGTWPIYPLIVFPFAALACAVIAVKRIQRSMGQLEGEWAARLALLLTMVEILLVSTAFRLPGEALCDVVNVAFGILFWSLYVYALWPPRGQSCPEFRIVSYPREQHSESHHD